MSELARLGAKVRALRRREKLTQAQMANRLAVSPSYLNLIENNRRPLTATLLLKHAQEFQLDLASFSPSADARVGARRKTGEVELELLGVLQQERRRQRAPVVLDEVQVARAHRQSVGHLRLRQLLAPSQRANFRAQSRQLAHVFLPASLPECGNNFTTFTDSQVVIM